MSLTDTWTAIRQSWHMLTGLILVFFGGIVWGVHLSDGQELQDRRLNDLERRVEEIDMHGSRELQNLVLRVETTVRRIENVERHGIAEDMAMNEMRNQMNIINERQQTVLRRLQELEQRTNPTP